MIIIAGCGYIGEKLASDLHDAGQEVCGLTHSAESAARLGAEYPWKVMAVDISDAAAVRLLSDALAHVPVDAVIHCASSGRGGAEAYQRVYVDGMRHLIAAFPAAFPIFASSTSVYSQTDESVVTEESDALPDKETGRLLLEAEKIALAAGGAVVRLAGLYGRDRSYPLLRLLQGRAEIEGGDGRGRIINQIHRDDAASALAYVATKRLKGIFNAVDDQPMHQGDCLKRLAEIFNLPLPPQVPANPDRKRGWTSKHVSNARLRACGWQPQMPNVFEALRHDPVLVPTILDQAGAEEEVRLPRASNVVLVGLMGCGKTSVGKLVASMLGFRFLDTDAMIVEAAGCSIPDIFAKEGEAGFRKRESAVLRSLLGMRNAVIATGGGIITQPQNLPLLRHLGYIVWLQASPALLHRRTSFNHDRPLLRDPDPKGKLERLLEERGPIYKSLADLRIATDELSQEESAYGVAESARVFFCQRQIA
ncbi:MAG: NAD-dependent epimerase/dehydratase family protein [Verrucomicrobiales bacterium]|nr:NAD-dependent epimerase/dehydratase family protein [Verrucomicrobiales bacterium]MCP5560912.1 NAD-dependent epimerase/dehydratase family protein [Verrucomicrobiaceae bacterium]